MSRTIQLTPSPLRLGAVIATADLANCVPIDNLVEPHRSCLLVHQPDFCDVTLTHVAVGADYCDEIADLTEQLPYGDFRPGRYGWMLTDIQPLKTPVLAKGKQGLWNWEAS